MTAHKANKCTKCIYILLIIAITGSGTVNGIEPISAITGTAIVTGIFGASNFFYCKFAECCDERSVPGDIEKLKQSLSRTLYGQHIVQQYVVSALSGHLQSTNPSRKPLVMSFHGTPGTGKSFVADKIAEALYLEGTKSKYVHKFLGRADFAHPGRLNEYKERINNEVRQSIKQCPRSLFIFDEVDKMPIGVFDTLTSFIDYAANKGDADYTKAIFIFLSNTAGIEISDHLVRLMKSGKRREDTKLSDFEKMLELSAYNMEGGLKKTNMIEAHVIDHYVPFLALEKAHIIQCVEAEFQRHRYKPTLKDIQLVVNNAVTYDPKHSMFVTSGCKTIEKKVAIVVYDNRT
ncbi:torsin-like protein [Drosophila mojavensis]|uniref:AAA+ ATPase domain-containing protein n=1 Tax=Drosophila mojavensis TaxID=7230 RepID=B4L707_DROMO|nr:torsin-like protein [Drosophila mojavensis]EDW06153.2 uncharacterized protein Dmoj_GI16067 [Drosophila mojavensis]